jgi:ferredoxin
MFERYHVSMTPAPNRAPPVPKFVITRASNCVNCGKCEKACIYGVHERSKKDLREMADPLSHLCKNCFRCVADCPQRAITMSVGPEYRALGRGLWTSQRIATVWGEAETGKIPVLGAGYRGPFAGPNFDGMWTDMSEIVRPTRDGIHGREFISTSVDIGAKPLSLEFDKDGGLVTSPPDVIELPVPTVLDISRMRTTTENTVTGFAMAARELGTLMFVPYGIISFNILEAARGNIVPVYPESVKVDMMKLPEGTRMAEVHVGPGWRETAERFGELHPGVILSLRVRGGQGVERKVVELAQHGTAVVHVDYDRQGMEEGSDARHVMHSLRSVHKALAAEGIRDRVTIISGGGIAAAEHVPKTVICGADVVAVERALVIALECRNCITCSRGSCPINLQGAEPDWVRARTVNMIGAWRDQMLEMMGAMGIREVRRLRGEVGRAIFFDDLERDMLTALTGGAKHA